MNGHHLKPLEGEALEALESEKLRPDPSPLHRARVRARLLESLTAPNEASVQRADRAPDARGPSASGSSLGGGSLRILGRAKLAGMVGTVLLAGGVVGVVVNARLATPSMPIHDMGVPAAPPSPSARASWETPIDNIAPAEIPTQIAPLPSAIAPDRPRAPAESDLKTERALLDRAREALTRGDDAEVLAILDAHAQKFQAGRLIEEREALAIKALVRSGHSAEAQRRGARFRARFPQSLLLPAIDNALGTKP